MLTNIILQEKLKLNEIKFGCLEFTNVVLKQGIECQNSRFHGEVNLSGVVSRKVTNFRESHFNKAISLEEHLLPSGAIISSKLANSDFTSCKFFERQNSSGAVPYCANFNDVEFVGYANFSKVSFQGVAKFHGAKVHSETTFRGFETSVEFENWKQIDDEKLHEYQSAFRSLRQHMESISSSAEAFEFGRLEMLAKQHRKDVKSVPKSVSRATWIYGALADYG